MAKGGELDEELDVSIRWPKGYYEDEPAAPRRRRKASSAKKPAPRRAPASAIDPETPVDEVLVSPPLVDRPPVDDADLGRDQAELRERVDRLSEQLSGVTVQITEALITSSKAVRRVEQLTSALSIEVAEIGQTISDQVAGLSSATTDEVRTRTRGVSTEVGRISKSVTDSLATVTRQLDGLTAAVADTYDRPVGSPNEGFGDLLEGTSEAVTRIETLVEALIEASDARPTDISEFSARTLERLGLTVGSRFEASTTTAVDAIDTAVNEAIDRATSQFKEMAPPVVDRSTTAAITRLEERVAELTRQRDELDKETKATLNGLEETVGRLASAQAEDLERILDTIEGASLPTPAPTRHDDERLARIEASLAALAGAPPASQGASDIAEQFDIVNQHLAALRRRLPVRARPGAGGLDQRSLRELATLVAQQLATSIPAPPRPAKPSATRTSSRSAPRRPPRE